MSEDEQLDTFLAETVAAFKSARGDEIGVARAVKDYLDRGNELELSPMELWDYFAISSPGIPEQAGYDQVQQEKAVALFDKQSKQKFV